MKAIVLSSGGVDSTTCVSLAVSRYGQENVSTVSIFYGQKHDKEIQCARQVASHYGLQHYEFDLSKIMQYSNCSLLTGSTEEIKHKSYAEQIAEDGEGKVSTYVPFRNGLMLSVAASLAQSVYPDEPVMLMYGAHADDAAGQAYADCSPEFAEAIGSAIRIGTYGEVRLEAPFVNCTKAELVAEGLKLGTPYELTWSCYEGGAEPCGQCGTCIDRAQAFAANGVKDPALK